MGRLALTAAAIVCAAGAASASAAMTVGGPQTLATGTNVVWAPQVLYDSSGGQTIVWGDRFSASPGVKWLRVAPDGTAGSVHQLTTTDTIGPISAGIDSDGDVTAAWLDMNGLQRVRIASDGDVDGPTGLGGFGSNPKVVVDGSDRATIVWASDSVYAMRLADDGTIDYAARPLATATGNDIVNYPDAGVDSQGRVSVAWARATGDTPVWSVHYMRVAADGTPGTDRTLGDTGSNTTLPRVVVDSADRATTVWTNAGDDDELVARRELSDGTLEPVRVLDAGPTGDYTVDAVADSQGRVTAAMQIPAGGGAWNVVVARLAADGTVAWSRTIPNGSDVEPAVRLALGSSDRVTAAFYGTSGWNAFRIGASGSFGRLVSFTGPSSALDLARAPDGEIVITGNHGGLVQAKTGTVNPTVAIDSGPNGTVEDQSPTFAFSSNEPEATFECSWDGSAFAACTSPATFDGSLPEGGHSFQVRATDPDGLTATSTQRSFTVSDGAPETTILTGPADGSRTTATSATFTFSADETGATFECSLDDGAFAACQSPRTVNGLAPGPHTFRVRAVDGIGNADPIPAQRSFTVEAVQPPPPPPDDGACEKAKAKLDKAKAKLKKLKKDDAPKAKVKKAKAKVKKAKAAVKKAC